MKSTAVRIVFAVCLCGSALSAGPITYRVVDLGSLNGTSASANGINASGETAATISDPYGNLHVLSAGRDITPTGTDGLGAAINASGQVAGTTYQGGTPYASVWTGGVAQMLSANSYAMGISDNGQVTGSSAGHAFLYSSGSSQDLGVLSDGSWSSGYAVNSDGTVAGYGDTASGTFRAIVWAANGRLTALGTLGGANSYAFGLNASGQVTGSAQTASGYLHAFTYSGEDLVDLGTLGGTCSYGYGINGSGTVVGYSYTADGVQHAFVYQDGFMYDLNALMADTGWQVTAAYGINDSGQIAGSAMINGVEHAVRLDPIEPENASQPLTSISLLDAPLDAPLTETPEPGTWLTGIACAGLLLYRSAKARLK